MKPIKSTIAAAALLIMGCSGSNPAPTLERTVQAAADAGRVYRCEGRNTALSIDNRRATFWKPARDGKLYSYSDIDVNGPRKLNLEWQSETLGRDGKYFVVQHAQEAQQYRFRKMELGRVLKNRAVTRRSEGVLLAMREGSLSWAVRVGTQYAFYPCVSEEYSMVELEGMFLSEAVEYVFNQ